jgi:nucleotide-binding universal stress UspA family protein
MLKVLVPVDGSECAGRAVEFLVKHANWYKDGVEIHLLTVHPPIPSGAALAAIGKDKVNQYYREEGLETLKPARAKLDAAKLAYDHHIGVGEPADVIAQYAKDKNADQVVMGTHGRGQVGAALLGSVAAKVIQRVPMPVLLVK